MPVLGSIIVGALIAFLYYNVFKNQYFRGDTDPAYCLISYLNKFMEGNVAAVRPLAITMTSAPWYSDYDSPGY